MTEIKGIFNFSDRVQMAALNQRVTRSQVLHSNISNAETPGFRAIGYDFEEQLKSLYNREGNEPTLKATNPRHFVNTFTNLDGDIMPDVYVRPTESVGSDGNTVDVDAEMADLAENQILFRATVDTINRKIALIRYAIHGGRS